MTCLCLILGWVCQQGAAKTHVFRTETTATLGADRRELGPLAAGRPTTWGEQVPG